MQTSSIILIAMEDKELFEKLKISELFDEIIGMHNNLGDQWGCDEPKELELAKEIFEKRLKDLGVWDNAH